MSTKEQPMLADNKPILGRLDQIRFPMLASPKLDGYRALAWNGDFLSRKMKPIANVATREFFKRFECLDGELVVGSPTSPSVFRDTSSGVSTIAGDPQAVFWVFDHMGDLDSPYHDRLEALRALIIDIKLELGAEHSNRIRMVHQTMIHSVASLLAYEETCLRQGYEGVMLRLPSGPYKMGRATWREHYLLKLKRWESDEAQVIGWYELEHNANEATTDERGYTKRSTHKANKHGLGTLGGLVLRRRDGVEFRCGGGKGFDMATRAVLWASRESLVGQWWTYEFLPVGIKEKPRHPRLVGRRHEDDMS